MVWAHNTREKTGRGRSNNHIVGRHIVVFSCFVLAFCRSFSVICLKFVMEREAFDDEFYEGLEDIDWNDGWSEVSEPCLSGFVKRLEDIDWDENWSEV